MNLLWVYVGFAVVALLLVCCWHGRLATPSDGVFANNLACP
jgi:hypothetical protein